MRTTTSRTLTLPSGDAVPRTTRTYRVHGTWMDGEFQVGITVRSGEDGSVDELPHAVYETISDSAQDHVDFDRLGTDATDATWPNIGMATLSPVDGSTVTLFIEWLPSYLETPGDEES